MKLGRTSWLILTICIFVVAIASLGTIRSHQVQQQRQLEDELSIAGPRLDKLQLKQLYSQQEEFKEQLKQATAELEATKGALHQSIESIEVTDSLLEIAEACGVEITTVNSPGIASGKLEGIACFLIRPAITAEGDIPNLLGFITKLNTELITAAIESAEITIPEATSQDSPSANIRLVIYDYHGG